MATEKYEAEFIVDIKGETTGQQFTGKFKVRTRLSFAQHLLRDEIRRTLLGPTASAASEGASFVAIILSEMAVRTIEAPSWWKNADGGKELSDLNVIAEIFSRASKAEQDLIDSLVKDGEKAQADLRANPPAST